MLILELFDNPMHVEIVSNEPDVCHLAFGDQQNVYDFYGTYSSDNSQINDDVNQIWYVEFSLRGEDGVSHHKATNTGKAFQVFASVRECAEILLRTHPYIERFVFSAATSEPSRVKLYDRMVKTVKVPGWKCETTRGHGTTVMYTYIRNQ